MKSRTLGPMVLAVVLVMVTAACRREAPPREEEPAKPVYKIVFMGDLTGPAKSLCIGPRNAVGMAVEEANAKGDLAVKLSFSGEDTQGDPNRALPIGKRVAADNEVIAVVGPCFSGESFSTGPDLEAAAIPRVTPSATNPGLSQQGWTHWFRGVGNDSSQGGPTPEIILGLLKARKVYIGHDKSAYGEGLATIVRDGMKRANPAALVGFEGVDPGREDYSPLVSNVVASRADAFYWGAYEKEAGLIVKQLRERGFKGSFVAADGSKGSDFLKVGAAAAEGAVLTCPCADPNTSQDAEAKAFGAAYKEKFGEEPTIYAGEGYDAATILIEAIRKAGKPAAGVRAYREAVTGNVAATSGLKGVTKAYRFQASGELVSEAVEIYLYRVKGGKYVLEGTAADLLK